MQNLGKEVVLGMVFAAVVVVLTVILFYEYIPTELGGKEKTYEQTKSTSKLLSQIKEEREEEERKEEKNEETLKSYDVTSEKLETSLENKDYVQGKNHPFFDYTRLQVAATGEEGDDEEETTSEETVPVDESKPIDESKFKDTTDKSTVSK